MIILIKYYLTWSEFLHPFIYLAALRLWRFNPDHQCDVSEVYMKPTKKIGNTCDSINLFIHIQNSQNNCIKCIYLKVS